MTGVPRSHRRSVPALLVAFLAACNDGGLQRRGESGTLGDSCTSASGCQSELVCHASRCVAGLPAGACKPPGNPEIVVGAVAGPPARPATPQNPPCALPVRPAAFPNGTVVELQEQPVGAQLTFEVPPGTASFTIVAQEAGGSAVDDVTVGSSTIANSVQPSAIFQPSSTAKFFDILQQPPFRVTDPTKYLAYYYGFLPSSGSMTVPNTSAALDLVRSAGAVTPGTWSFTLSDRARDCSALTGCTGASTSGRYDVKVLTKPGPLTATGALDVDLYLVTAPTPATETGPAQPPRLRAADAVADPATSPKAAQFRRFVGNLSTIFARAGICLGKVTVHDVPDWAVEDYAVVRIDSSGPCDELSQLFTLAVPTNAVHLFLVDELLDATGGSGGYVVVGIDGSIPGPSGVPGTIASGAAVTIADFGEDGGTGACARGAFDVDRCGTDLVSYISAHEAGHWLGLYHTTESSGTFFDPLSDTPTCVCDACAQPSQIGICGSGGAMVGAERCARKDGSCAGGPNLMFWSINGRVSAGTLSREQGEVMRLNPAVH
jgi:hypothetical protein